MNIQIEKFKSRFSVKCRYDVQVFDLIHNIDKKYWDKSKLEWNLPIAAFDNFMEDISKLGEYNIKVKETKPLALLSKKNNMYELKFVNYVDQFETFQNIDNVEYDKDNKKLIVPVDKFDEFLEILKTKCSGYYINDNEHKISDEQPISKAKKSSKNASVIESRPSTSNTVESTIDGN